MDHGYCKHQLSIYQLWLVHLYLNIKHKLSLNVITRLMLSLLYWPKVILLSGGHSTWKFCYFIAVIRYGREGLRIWDKKLYLCYSRECVITAIVITEFHCIGRYKEINKKLFFDILVTIFDDCWHPLNRNLVLLFLETTFDEKMVWNHFKDFPSQIFNLNYYVAFVFFWMVNSTKNHIYFCLKYLLLQMFNSNMADKNYI